MSSHASREWITSARSSSCASRIWARNAASCSSARRVLVVEVEAGLADRRPRRRIAASATSVVPLVGEPRRVVRVQADGGPHVGVAPRRASTACREVARSVPTHTIALDPGVPGPRRAPRRRSPGAVGRWQWQSTQPPVGHASRSRLDAGEERGALLQRRARRAGAPHGGASGRRWSSGAPGSPRRRHSSAAARGITGDASSATIRSASRQSPSTARDRGRRRPPC